MADWHFGYITRFTTIHWCGSAKIVFKKDFERFTHENINKGITICQLKYTNSQQWKTIITQKIHINVHLMWFEIGWSLHETNVKQRMMLTKSNNKPHISHKQIQRKNCTNDWIFSKNCIMSWFFESIHLQNQNGQNPKKCYGLLIPHN
jgi:hypothetical protein